MTRDETVNRYKTKLQELLTLLNSNNTSLGAALGKKIEEMESILMLLDKIHSCRDLREEKLQNAINMLSKALSDCQVRESLTILIESGTNPNQEFSIGTLFQ